MTRLEDRLYLELSTTPDEDQAQDFADLLAARLQQRRRGRVALLVIVTLLAAVLVTGLLLEVATLLPN